MATVQKQKYNILEIEAKDYKHTGKININSKITYVTSLSDFPTPVSNIITLEPNMSYYIMGDIDIGDNSIQFSEGSSIYGINNKVSILRNTSTNPLLQATDISVFIRDLQINSNSDTFNLIDNTSTKYITIENCIIISGGKTGTLKGYYQVLFNRSKFYNPNSIILEELINIAFTSNIFEAPNAITTSYYNSSQTGSTVNPSEYVYIDTNTSIGEYGHIYQNTSTSSIVIDNTTDYLDTNIWTDASINILSIINNTNNINFCLFNQCYGDIPEGYIGLFIDQHNTILDHIDFTSNSFKGKGSYIEGIEHITSDNVIFHGNFGIREPIRLSELTTEELTSFTQPKKGDLFYNTDENGISFFNGSEFKLINTSTLYSTIFTEDFETGNSLTLVNDSTNIWIRGNADSYTGSYSLYISNDGINPVYNGNVSNVSHAYFDISIPVTSEAILEIYWECEGEINYDYMRIYMTDTTYTPTAGSLPSSSYLIGQSQYNNNTIWKLEQINLGSYSTTTTKRIIFSWRNDSSVGNNPPAMLDNIKIKIK